MRMAAVSTKPRKKETGLASIAAEENQSKLNAVAGSWDLISHFKCIGSN